MTLINKRNSMRFDRSLFIRYRQLDGLTAYSLGMTSNISSEGFCFQSQNIELETGDNLEFRFNKPETNQSVQFYGDVMWMQKEDMKCTAGVRFRVTDKKNRKKMLKIISDFFTIPVDQLLYSNGKKGSGNYRSRRAVQADKGAETAGTWSPTLILKRWMKICFHLAMITVVTIAFVLFMPVFNEEYEHVTRTPVIPLIQTAVYDNAGSDASTSMSVVKIREAILSEHEKSEESFVTARNDELALNEKSIDLPEKEKRVVVMKPQDTPVLTGNSKFDVQVASLKDPNIAYKMLLKVRNYYPEAALFNMNNFYVIRIPGIATEKQGSVIIREIEGLMDVTPILVTRLK